MRRTVLGGIAIIAVLTAMAAGYRFGAGSWPDASLLSGFKAPSNGSAEVPKSAAKPRSALYWRHPDNAAEFSAQPKKTADGRDYLPVYDDEEPQFEPAKAEPPKDGRRILYYRNPMGLPDISLVPKKDSMGMDYIPVYEGEVDEGDTVKVSPGKIQRTGVKTEVVGKRQMTRDIRAPGVVEIDERRVSVVAPRFDGYIESVGPVTSGTHVKKGQPLMTVFGQELLNQAARLLVEQKGADPGATPGFQGRSGIVVGARRRLLNFGVPEEFIDTIKRTRTVPDTFSWPAPRDGVVLERNAVDGQGFKAGDVLFRIADHSVVWVIANVAEGDMGALKPGQSVKVTTRAHPGRVFTGNVAVIYPHLMKETRTARVRIELPNPDLALLPDMYADVDIATGSDEPVVAVPSSAVIDSGDRQVIILDRGEGRFEPRDVKLGRKGDGYVEVTSGIRAGESIVVDGNFLIDAESNLQSALKGLTTPPAGGANQ
jgi:Cu(I)/Ag(I) efflux system membrane fusion protein